MLRDPSPPAIKTEVDVYFCGLGTGGIV